MRTDVVNAVAPSGSPEESPAMSFAAALFSSPACLSDRRAPLISRRTQAGAWLGRASACFAGRRFFGPAHQ